jgi:pimeloyl-ACP methyl ester carboxylesterase
MNVLGFELRYLRTGSGPTVVLLHTLRTQLEYWDPVLRLLGQGFDVVAPDLPGHGRSAAPPVDYTANYFTDVTERFLDACDVQNAILVGESIGASIALALAARENPRIARVVALNPYDYGRGGGIRRSSPLAKVLFTLVHWPVVGPLVMSAGTKGILRRVMEGGVHDRRKLPPDLVEQLWECGSLPGHGRAFVSLCREWKGWIAARSAYPGVKTPVTLAYGDHDWSRPEEREANTRALPAARVLSLAACGHFSSLERPEQIADIIRDESSRVASAASR